MPDFKSKEIWVTTEDNPFNPFTQWNRWYDYDYHVCGYDTCGRIARLAPYSNNLSDRENEEILDQAIQELADTGFVVIIDPEDTDKSRIGFYRLVTPKDCVSW